MSKRLISGQNTFFNHRLFPLTVRKAPTQTGSKRKAVSASTVVSSICPSGNTSIPLMLTFKINLHQFTLIFCSLAELPASSLSLFLLSKFTSLIVVN